MILGSQGTFPLPDHASSGFLLQADGTNVWLDAGTGTFANLQRHTDYFSLSAVVLSHLHLDHILDFYPFYYGLRYSHDCQGPKGLKVYAPSGAEEFLRRILSVDGEADFGGYFDFQTINAESGFSVGPLEFSFTSARHPTETLAVRVSHQGRSLTYTADTAPSQQVVELAKGSNLLLSEASLQEAHGALEDVHMTAEEAGRTAAEAQVDRLVLTHISPGLDPATSIDQAAKHFSGEIAIADDGATFTV